MVDVAKVPGGGWDELVALPSLAQLVRPTPWICEWHEPGRVPCPDNEGLRVLEDIVVNWPRPWLVDYSALPLYSLSEGQAASLHAYFDAAPYDAVRSSIQPRFERNLAGRHL